MFISNAGFDSTAHPNYKAPLPSPRKAVFIPPPSNWTGENSTPSAVMVTPRDPPQQQQPGEDSRSNPTSTHQRAGSIIHTHRRGSCSADMLESAINALHENNGSLNSVNQPMNQDTTSMDVTGDVLNGHAAMPAQQQPQLMQFGVSRQQHQFGQTPAAPSQQQPQQRSILSSMDLMVPSSFARQRAQASNTPSYGMFKSSSHHTSHTAAAGDLLSMSRTMNSTTPMEASKKRAGSYQGNSNSFMQSSTINQFGAPQQQWAVPTATNNNMVNQVSVGSGSSYGSSGNAAFAYPQQNNGESFENQSSKRRCRRSDSFDMMDD